LYVDSVNNFVGINDPAPSYVLDVVAPASLVGSNVASFYNSDVVGGTYTSQIEGKLSSSGAFWYFTYNGGNYNFLSIGVDDLGSYVNGLNLTITGLNSLSLSNLTVTGSSASGGAMTVTGGIFNSNTLVNITNANGGGAKLNLSTAGITSTSDAFVLFNNSTATEANWTIGCDGSDSKAFKISRSATLGANDAIVIRNDTQRVGIGATYANITAPLTVGGVAAFAAGTAALPSIARSTDLDTGIWFPTATNTIAASTNGTEKLRITSAGDVGINETSPDYKLDVNGTFGFTPGASVNPVDNGDVVFELTSNTTLTIKARGSDNTVRSVALVLV
jgi:hypothetical protein